MITAAPVEEDGQLGRVDWCLGAMNRWSYLVAVIFGVYSALGLALIPLNLSMIVVGLWEPVGWEMHLYFPVAGAVGAIVFTSLGYAAGRLRGEHDAD